MFIGLELYVYMLGMVLNEDVRLSSYVIVLVYIYVYEMNDLTLYRWNVDVIFFFNVDDMISSNVDQWYDNILDMLMIWMISRYIVETLMLWLFLM